MATQNTQFQQRDPDVITYATFDGLRNDIAPERFELGDLAVARNIDIDKSGRLARRAGFTSALAGAAHSLWADENQEVCLFVGSGGLRRLLSDMTAQTVTPLLDAVARMAYARVSDRVYFSNGRDLGVLEGGVVRTWGLPAAPLPTVAAAVGLMPAGTYQFVMTWLRADGQESGCGMAGRIELQAGGGLDVTFPPAPQADVVGCILYLSAANGDVLRTAGVFDPGTTLAWKEDPLLLSEELATQFMGPPPAGRLIAYYRGHMFVAVGDTLYFSQPFGYELFDLRRYLQLDGRITLLAPFTDMERTATGRDNSGFFIGTDRSMGVLAGTDPLAFQYVPKVDYGAIEGTLQYVEGTLLRDGSSGARKLPMWLSTKGVCVGVPDLLINNLTRSRYEIAAGGQGAAVFLPNPNRFIATSNL